MTRSARAGHLQSLSFLLAQGCRLCAPQQVGGFPGYTGRPADVTAQVAHDPIRKCRSDISVSV
jgi:hypothetical protein